MPPIRRSATVVAVLWVALSAQGGVVSAAPSVALEASFAARPGQPASSDATGVTLALGFTMSGEGYGPTSQRPRGGVPPLSEIDFSLPQGATFDAGGFAPCKESTLLEVGPFGCARGSRVGTRRDGLAEVTAGQEPVPESFSLQPFVSPGGGLLLYGSASSPVGVEFVSPATVGSASATPYGPNLDMRLPPIATVPGGALMSINTMRFELGADPSGTVSYLKLAANCPSGGLPLKAELTFGGRSGDEREFGIPRETVTVTTRVRCPAGLPASLRESLPGTGGAVTAPSNKACVSRRDFRIHVLQIEGLIYRRVAVDVNGNRDKTVKGRQTSARVDLHGLPKGRYTVKITVTTSTGRRISGIRAYHTCAAKRLAGGHPRL